MKTLWLWLYNLAGKQLGKDKPLEINGNPYNTLILELDKAFPPHKEYSDETDIRTVMFDSGRRNVINWIRHKVNVLARQV